MSPRLLGCGVCTFHYPVSIVSLGGVKTERDGVGYQRLGRGRGRGDSPRVTAMGRLMGWRAAIMVASAVGFFALMVRKDRKQDYNDDGYERYVRGRPMFAFLVLYEMSFLAVWV